MPQAVRITVLCAFLFPLLAGTCSVLDFERGTAIKNRGTGTVAVIGDSITHGSRPQLMAALQDPWFANVEATHSGHTIGTLYMCELEEFLNPGTCPSLPKPSAWDVLGSPVEAAVINLGTNDSGCARGTCDPPHATDFDDLRSHQESMAASFAGPVCTLATTVGVRNIFGPVDPTQTNQNWSDLVASGQIDGLIDWKPVLDANWTAYAADDVGHLTAAGKVALATLTRQRLDEVCGPRDVMAIHMKGSGPNATYVRILDAAANTPSQRYKDWQSQQQSALHRTNPSVYDFEAGDFNRDGNRDVYAIRYSDNGSVRVRVMDGARGYNKWLGQFVTPLAATNDQTYDFEVGDHNNDGIHDLYAIKFQGAQNKIQVSVLNGATNFATWLVYQHNTVMAQTVASNWDFEVGDINGDGEVDVVGVKYVGNSGKTEVHMVPGPAYQTRTKFVTTLNTTSATTWDFEVGDHDADGTEDVYAIRYDKNNKTGIHVLDAGTGFTSYIQPHHGQSVLAGTNAQEWTFLVGPSR